MATKAELEEKINSLAENFEQKGKKDFDPLEHKDKIRSKIALIFTLCYFSLIFIILIGAPIYNAKIAYYSIDSSPLNIKDLLLIISGIIGTPLGLVIGYYFKGAEKE